jgi:hypothetical protein
LDQHITRLFTGYTFALTGSVAVGAGSVGITETDRGSEL